MKNDTDRVTRIVQTRLTPGEYEQLAAAAGRQERTVSAFIRWLVRQALGIRED